MCGEHDEIVIHILWQCPLARNVWALVHGKLQKCDSSAHNFLSLARALVEKLSRKDLETWAMVAWSIWNAWNQFQFEASKTPPHANLKGPVSLLDEYQRLARSMARRWAHVCAVCSFGGPLYTFLYFSLWVKFSYWMLSL